MSGHLSEAALNTGFFHRLSHILPNQMDSFRRLRLRDDSTKLRNAASSIKGGVDAVVYHEGIKSPFRDQCRRLGEELGVPVLKHKLLRRPEELMKYASDSSSS